MVLLVENPSTRGFICLSAQLPGWDVRLERAQYISALFSIRYCENSRLFYDRKRAEGKRHIQAVLALARRRVNVLWALLRDGRRYEPAPPPPLVA